MKDSRSADVLWIGGTSAELAVARHAPAMERHACVIEAPDISAAVAWLATQPTAPDLIAICQSRPGQIAHDSIEQLRRHAPLARLVGILGSWCEGESRSGRPWLTVERVYWHQWPIWIARELALLRAGPAVSWSMPQTATPEERWLALQQGRQDLSSKGGLVAIVSSHREFTQAASDACIRYGRRAVCFDQPPTQLSGIERAIWDADRCGASEAEQLRTLVRAVRPAPVIALLAFPRIEDEQRAFAAGAQVVCSKPIGLAQLFA